jgi:hypothetical protein
MSRESHLVGWPKPCAVLGKLHHRMPIDSAVRRSTDMALCFTPKQPKTTRDCFIIVSRLFRTDLVETAIRASLKGLDCGRLKNRRETLHLCSNHGLGVLLLCETGFVRMALLL